VSRSSGIPSTLDKLRKRQKKRREGDAPMIANESQGLNLRRVHPGFRQRDRAARRRMVEPQIQAVRKARR